MRAWHAPPFTVGSTCKRFKKLPQLELLGGILGWMEIPQLDKPAIVARRSPNKAKRMLTRADNWLAEQLIAPVMAVFLRSTRQSKSAASRMFWFLVALDGYYHANNLFALIVFSAMAVLMLVAGSLHAEANTRSRLRFRLLGLCFLLVFAARGMITGVWQGVEFWVLVTFAQYAAAVPDCVRPAAPVEK